MMPIYIILSIIVFILLLNTTIIKSIIYHLLNNLKTSGFFSYYYVYKEIFIDDTYGFLPIKDNMVIFDVGANIGLYNLYANTKAKNLKVYSFEPIKDIFDCMEHNVNKNKIRIKNNNENILINKGLGESNKVITMNYIKDASALSSGCEFDENKLEAHNSIYKEKCGIFHNICKEYLETRLKNPLKVKGSITTIDDIIAKYQIKNIDILKIDVECYEYQVLQGISIDNFKLIQNIILEIENFRENNKNNIIRVLQNNNFIINYNTNIKDNWITIYAYR